MVNFLMACARRGRAPSLPATWPPCPLPLNPSGSKILGGVRRTAIFSGRRRAEIAVSGTSYGETRRGASRGRRSSRAPKPVDHDRGWLLGAEDREGLGQAALGEADGRCGLGEPLPDQG